HAAFAALQQRIWQALLNCAVSGESDARESSSDRHTAAKARVQAKV
ncbi:MAG: hypothetical protein JWP63_2742, partial [Candidatus Solibacter sp.]|nr:hypothetical protein [Candidatus Solibacter sp.]